MRKISRYSLTLPKTSTQRAELVCGRRRSGLKVDGLVLEEQFELADGRCLVWLTDDAPYDEGLHVYLIGDDDSPADAVEASSDFTAGILSISDTGSDWVEFGFFLNDIRYRLEVGKFRHRVRLPPGWRYKRRFQKHSLMVTEVPDGGL